jgi:RNA polymerase sigma factor (sigma-70 family)
MIQGRIVCFQEKWNNSPRTGQYLLEAAHVSSGAPSMARGQLGKVVDHLCGVVKRQEAASKADADLLQRFVRGNDQAAFEALVRRHGPMVLGVCKRVLRDPNDAEDAFQATFIVLIRKAAALRKPALLGNWLYGVAYRTAQQARKAACKRQTKEANVPARSANSENANDDLARLLDQELDRLSEKQRALLVLCDLEGHTRKEAADLLGLPEGTVASRLARARTMLANRLKRHGLMVTGGTLGGVLSAHTASAGVPPTLLTATVQAGSALGAGQALATVVSVKVKALAEGVLKMMLLTKLKTLTTIVLTFGLLAASGAGFAYHANGREQAVEKPQPLPIVLPAPQDKKADLPIVKKPKDLKQLFPEPSGPSDQVATQKLMDGLAAMQAELGSLKARLTFVEDELKRQSAQPKQPADVKLVQVVHQVRDLVEESNVQPNALVEAISSTIEPQSWSDRGGRGTIQYLGGTMSLVISQTKAIHSDVDRLLQQLRQERERDRIGTVEKRKAIEREFVRKVFSVGELVDKDGDSLVMLIVRAVGGDTWELRGAGGYATISYLADTKTLVVRNTPEILTQIATLLDELRSARTRPDKAPDKKNDR